LNKMVRESLAEEVTGDYEKHLAVPPPGGRTVPAKEPACAKP
jgi:hypothetical protein